MRVSSLPPVLASSWREGRGAELEIVYPSRRGRADTKGLEFTSHAGILYRFSFGTVNHFLIRRVWARVTTCFCFYSGRKSLGPSSLSLARTLHRRTLCRCHSLQRSEGRAALLLCLCFGANAQNAVKFFAVRAFDLRRIRAQISSVSRPNNEVFVQIGGHHTRRLLDSSHRLFFVHLRYSSIACVCNASALHRMRPRNPGWTMCTDIHPDRNHNQSEIRCSQIHQQGPDSA